MQTVKNQHIYSLTSGPGLSASSFFLGVAWAFRVVRDDGAENGENPFLEVIFPSDLLSSLSSTRPLFLNIVLGWGDGL